MTQNVSQNQIRDLMKDWMGEAREEGFIHRNVKNTIFRPLSEGEAISDYMLSGRRFADELEVLRSAREIAQTVANTVADKPVEVNLGVDDSYTDGKTIIVATSHFDRTDLTTGHKTDILCGFAVHESCHINWTDFDMLKSYIESQNAPRGVVELKKNISNILEDERIEELVGEKMPGMADYLGEVKDYIWGKYAEKVEKLEEQKEADPVVQALFEALDCLLKAVRFPAALKEETVERNYDLMVGFRAALTPYPRTGEAVYEATDAIYELIKNLVKDAMDKKSQQGEGDGQSGSGQTTDAQAETKIDGVLNKGADNKAQRILVIIQGIGEEADGGAKDMDGSGGGSGSGSGGSGADARTTAIMSERELTYVNGHASRQKDNFGRWTYIKAIKGNAREYNQSLRRVRHLVPAMRNALTCKTNEYEYVVRGMKSGKLNANKFASYASGSRAIFTHRGEVKSDCAKVVILIDESGSMGTTRKLAARDAAVLIRESLKGIANLEYFAYGFTTRELNVYAEGRMTDNFGLGSTKDSGGTPTSDAMRRAMERLRANSRSKILMLVLTDGEPDDWSDTVKADEECRRNGVIPIGVGIEGCSGVQRIFKESIVVNNTAELPRKALGVVRKKLMEILKSTDSVF